MHLQKIAIQSKDACSAEHDASHFLAIAAFGNSLRGDDAAASFLIERLRFRLGPVCTLDAGSHTSALPAFLHEHKIGIIIDTVSGTEEIVKLDISELTDRQRASIDCSHALSWLDEIILFKEKFSIPERLYFIGIPSYETSWTVGLSERLIERLPELEAQLCKLIEVEIAANA